MNQKIIALNSLKDCEFCPACGRTLVETHAKAFCNNCGYTHGCCDLA